MHKTAIIRPMQMKTKIQELGRKDESIADRLVALRATTGLDQKAFGKRCGIGKTTYNNYETGFSQPSIASAIRIVTAFNVTLDWLFLGRREGLTYGVATKIYPPSE